MSRLISSFIIEPVFRQARRFSGTPLHGRNLSEDVNRPRPRAQTSNRAATPDGLHHGRNIPISVDRTSIVVDTDDSSAVTDRVPLVGPAEQIRHDRSPPEDRPSVARRLPPSDRISIDVSSAIATNDVQSNDTLGIAQSERSDDESAGSSALRSRTKQHGTVGRA